jgi:hypothetical protein
MLLAVKWILWPLPLFSPFLWIVGLAVVATIVSRVMYRMGHRTKHERWLEEYKAESRAIGACTTPDDGSWMHICLDKGCPVHTFTGKSPNKIAS